MAHRRSITNPWRAITREHTRFRSTVEYARHLWEQKPGIDMKTLAKKAACTPALAYYATKELRQNYRRAQRKLVQPTWQPTSLGAVRFKSRSAKARYYLSHATKLSQAEIARACNLSGPRISQLAAEMK